VKKKEVFLLIVIAGWAGKVLFVDNLNYQANDFAPLYVAAQLIAEGKIKAKKIGRGWKVFKSELDYFLRC